MGVTKTYSIIHQIEIYSVDSTIQHFNNQGKVLYHQDKALCSLYSGYLETLGSPGQSR